MKRIVNDDNLRREINDVHKFDYAKCALRAHK